MEAPATVHHVPLTAVVHAADGIRFVAVSACAAGLAAQVIAYIRERCDDVLWPPAAERVRGLIDDGKPYAAIAMYFENVGERWDAERLEFAGLPDGSNVANAVAPRRNPST
jgi:hypothetical protein